MPRVSAKKVRSRRTFSEEFKQEAVQMVLDGHSAASVAERLGARWAQSLVSLEKGFPPHGRTGWLARSGDRVAHLEEELRRVERERDILKKALAILSRQV